MNETTPHAGEELLVASDGGVRILTLNRPSHANALSPDLARALAEAVVAADEDPEVRVIVLTASGARHFCAGADLKIKSSKDRAAKPVRNAMRGLRRSVFEIILESLKPTLAAIEGAAYGAGLELALCCDIRMASEAAHFCLPEAARGLSAQFATVLLPNIISRPVACEMLFTAEPMDSARALSVGLVNAVVPTGSALERTLAMARTIAGNAPISLRRMKETMSRAQNLPLPLALRLNEGLSPHGSADSKEGARAFVERRPPVFRGE